MSKARRNAQLAETLWLFDVIPLEGLSEEQQDMFELNRKCLFLFGIGVMPEVGRLKMLDYFNDLCRKSNHKSKKGVNLLICT